VVEELVPNLLPLGAVGKVLQNLLIEQIPIRDMLTILETLADWAPMIKDADTLTEYVRQALARTITKLYQSADGNIPVITLDQNIEKTVAQAVQHTEQGDFFPIEPSVAQKIMKSVTQNLEKFSEINQQPVVLCSPLIRSHFKKLADRFIPDLVVLSYNEIVNNIQIHSIGTVVLDDAN